MAEITPTEETTSQQTPQEPIQPISPIGQKLKEYHDERIQNEQTQKSISVKNKNKSYYNTSHNRDIMSGLNDPDYARADNPLKKFQPTAYNPGWEAGAFERYYTHPLYKKLGFSPYRDNEKVYNDASTGWQDFKRMSHQWGGLAGLGVQDMFSEIFSMNTLAEDVTNAKEMEKKMSIGSSSRPGIGSSLSNFALNTAYTAGIIGEMAAEELVLAGATLLTGGLDAEITAPLMASRAAKAGRLLGKGAKALSEIKSFNDAKKIFETSRVSNLTGRIGREAIDFLNPLERTTKLLRGETKAIRAGKSWEELNDFVKAKKTAGALWGDVTGIRAVVSESKLEGGGVYRQVKKKLVDEFYEKNGRGPQTQEEGDEIEKRSHEAARADVLGNIPLIYGSNKIVLETALGGIPSLEKLTKEAGKAMAGKIVKTAEGTYERAASFSMKGLRQATQPVNLAKHGFKYTLANFTEGFQEVAQEALAIANSDYFTQANNDPTTIGHKAYMTSIAKGMQAQLTGAGFETFASGFFMGGVLQGPQNLIFNAAPRSYYKIFQADKYNAYQKAKEDFTDNLVNAMNDVTKSPLTAIKAIDQNFLSQKNGRAYTEKAVENGDTKSAHDSKEEAMFDHIYTLLEGGKEDILKTQLKNLKEMDDNGLAEALNLEHLTPNERKDIRSRLDGFENKINQIKDKFEYYDQNFTNDLAPGSHEHQALEFAKKTAIFARYDFDNTLNRIKQITNTLSQHKPISKASFSDFSLLFEADKMNAEINTLKEEAKIYKESSDPDSRKQYAQKVEKLEHLRKLKEAISNYKEHITAKATKDNLTAKAKPEAKLKKSTEQLYEAYNKYVKFLGKEAQEHPLDDVIANSFKGIKDYYALLHDNQLAANAINTLADPNFLQSYIDRAVIIGKNNEEKVMENRRTALGKFIKRKENNDLLNALYEVGAYINPEDTEALVEKNIIPTQVYDTTTHKIIKPGSEKDKKVQEILEQFKLITTPPAEVIIPVENAPITTLLNKINILTPWEEVPQEIKLSLVAEFKKWNALKDEDEQFPIGKKTDEQLASVPALKSFWLHNAEAREAILKDYNEKTGRTQTGPIITKAGVPTTIPGGAIYYVSPGMGKSTLAEGSAIYVDGDKVLYDVMKLKGLNPSTPQNAGLELYKESRAIIDTVEKDARAKALELKSQGRIVLTSNRYSYGIVDKAYLSKDKKRMADEFQRRDSALSREEAERQAGSKIKNETEALQDKEIIDIPQGKFIDDLIVKSLPKLKPEDLTEVKTNDNFKARAPEESFPDFRDRILEEFIKLSETSSAGTLLVTDSETLTLITAWDNSGRSTDFTGIEEVKAQDKAEFKEFKFGDRERQLGIESQLRELKAGFDTPSTKEARVKIREGMRKQLASLESKSIWIASSGEARENGKKLAKENITAIIASPEAYDSAIIIEEEINKPQPGEVVPEELPVESFEQRFAKVNTIEELDALQTELAFEVIDKGLLWDATQTNAILEEMISNKRKEIVLRVDYDNIFKGDHLVMKDKVLYGETGHVIVVGKGPKAIQVRQFGQPNSTTRFITKDNLITEVEFKMSDDIQDTDIVPEITPEGEILAKENLKLQTNEAENLQDEKARLDKLKQSKKSSEQADTDLTEDTNCPT